MQDVLTGLLEMGITRATIMESQGMGRVVMDKMSIFAGFRDIWSGNLGYNHTLFTLIDDDMVDEVIRVVEDILSGVDAKSKGILFTFPVSRYVQLSDE